MGADEGSIDTDPQSLLSAAKLQFECADYLATERLARAALDVADASHDMQSAIEARVWVGAGLSQQGQYAAALRWLHEALDLTSEHALPLHAGRACNYIAVCHEELGDFPAAVEWYERGLVKTRHVGNREVEVYLLSNLADGWATAGSVDKAMPLLGDAIDVARSIGDQTHEGWCLSARARSLESLGEIDAARRDHAEAVEVVQRSGSERILAEVLRDEGAFFARSGDAATAIDRLTRSLELATKLNIRREMYRAHETLATVYEQLGQWQSALWHFRRFHALHADVFDDVVKAKLENLNAVSELQQAKHQQEIARLRNDELAGSLRQVEDQARELEKLSLRDPLTGICNRRYLEAALSEAYSRATLTRQPLCVAMIDVDRFKQINDRHGHAIGDDVLCRLAHLIEQRLRAGDILARYGGEEFVLVLPHIGLQQMSERAEAIRHAIEADDWARIAPPLKVTISLGIAGAEETGDWEALLALADKRMYRAKNTGRNRVCGPENIRPSPAVVGA